MSVRVITYDLNNPGQNYPRLLAAIKEFGAWAKLSESSYAVATNQSPHEVYRKLSAFIDRNDTLVVLTGTQPYAGQASQEVIDWLNRNL